MSTALKKFHDEFYTEKILDQDEKGNGFSKIEDLWVEDEKPLTVLDIGCGAGAVTGELVRRGHVVHGVDVQDQAVRRAKARGLLAQVMDLNEPLDFPSRFFDAVVAMDIVEHLYDPLALLAEIRRVLKDDGYALLGFPQHFDIIQRVRMLFGAGIVTAEHRFYSRDYRSWNYVHIRLFRFYEAYEMTQKAGFSVEKSALARVALSPFPLPVRAPLKLVLNRFTRRAFPSLCAAGVRLRVKKKD